MQRKNGEGLHQECSSKGKKEGTGGHTCGQVYGCYFPWQRCDWMFLVWRDHKWRIVFAVCQEQVSPYFFSKGNNQNGQLFLQDGDPSHNFKMSEKSMDEIPCRLFKITPRSPDLNHIWNKEEDQKRDLWTFLYSCYQHTS